jgi:hypothetical protein
MLLETEQPEMVDHAREDDLTDHDQRHGGPGAKPGREDDQQHQIDGGEKASSHPGQQWGADHLRGAGQRRPHHQHERRGDEEAGHEDGEQRHQRRLNRTRKLSVIHRLKRDQRTRENGADDIDGKPEIHCSALMILDDDVAPCIAGGQSGRPHSAGLS